MDQYWKIPLTGGIKYRQLHTYWMKNRKKMEQFLVERIQKLGNEYLWWLYNPMNKLHTQKWLKSSMLHHVHVTTKIFLSKSESYPFISQSEFINFILFIYYHRGPNFFLRPADCKQHHWSIHLCLHIQIAHSHSRPTFPFYCDPSTNTCVPQDLLLCDSMEQAPGKTNATKPTLLHL